MNDQPLVEPFDTDGDSLAGLSPQMCFALGVEWILFRAKLDLNNPFTDCVLAANAERLTKMAERAQRYVEARPAHEGWCLITVGNRKT